MHHDACLHTYLSRYIHVLICICFCIHAFNLACIHARVLFVCIHDFTQERDDDKDDVIWSCGGLALSKCLGTILENVVFTVVKKSHGAR